MSDLTSGALPGLAPPAVDTYTDYKALRARAEDSSPEGIRKAAKQFESVFLHLWLKSMREANASFGEGSYLSSPAMESHQQMLDGEMAVNLSNSGGIGLAEVIERQLSGLGTPVHRETDVRDPVTFSGRMPDAVDNPEPVPDAAGKLTFLERLSAGMETVLSATPLPRLGVLAQAALETGWGRHIVGGRDGHDSSFNLFGIKASGWSGPSVTSITREYLGGRFVQREEAFRSYDSLEAATTDYVDVLKGNQRYRQLFEAAGEQAGDTLTAVRRFADALQRGGYATDPAYADKIVDVARTIMRLTGGI